ncbi:hypothetical protein HWV62_37855, partial [Athelia sp. TMB]
MPFEKYIKPDDNAATFDPAYDDGARASMLGIDASTFSSTLQFQMPSFMQNGLPTLAHGGGAEAVPVSVLSDPGDQGYNWLAQNGFQNFQPSFKQYSPQPDEQPQAGPSYSGFEYNVEEQNFAEAVRTPGGITDPRTHNSWMVPGSSMQGVPFAARDLLSLASSSNGGFGVAAPSSMGLPVYSASGFDAMGVLARVATRPHPKIALGPVDLTCAFVVVDVRRYDKPIVYASPTFCALTGYSEREVLGKNCRFLQAPDGQVKRGEERRFVAPETVAHMHKAVAADKECQASIINYRKGGQAFINLVTIVPVPGGLHGAPAEADDIAYHVGFQVDLTEQPNAILRKLQDGSYILNYGEGAGVAGALGIALPPIREKRGGGSAVSKTLRALLGDPAFLESLPITRPPADKDSAASTPAGKEPAAKDAPDASQTLALLLLEHAPDFVLVLSLKGSFLYVAPAVRRVLGYAPDALVGRAVADYCHPADLVPLMRELKESSTAPAGDGGGPGPPKTVDLLFRARAAGGAYTWLECRGRLHVEPGKGRKAIILSGRRRGMPAMRWGGVRAPAPSGGEWWGGVSAQGTLLVVGGAVRGVLGWGAGEVLGRRLAGLAQAEDAQRALGAALERVLADARARPEEVCCEMAGVEVTVVLYRAGERAAPPVLVQVVRADAPAGNANAPLQHDAEADIFAELETGRASSWQYELQQLKFANQRLGEEVAALEAGQQPAPQQQSRRASLPQVLAYGGGEVKDEAGAGLPVARQ